MEINSKKDLLQIKLSNLIGKSVYTKREGKFIGSVMKVGFNYKSKSISSIIIKESIWNREALIVKSEDIIDIGEDILNIRAVSSCNILTRNEMKEDSTQQNIIGHGVITKEGKLLGIVEDAMISTATFKIEKLVLKDYSYLDVSPEQIIVGPDDIIVPTSYESKVTEDYKTSLLNKFLHFKSHEEIEKEKIESKDEI